MSGQNLQQWTYAGAKFNWPCMRCGGAISMKPLIATVGLAPGTHLSEDICGQGAHHVFLNVLIKSDGIIKHRPTNFCQLAL